jgi:hypothetical protein
MYQLHLKKLDCISGVAELRQFGQIRFQSILRVPHFNQQIFHKNLQIGTQ